MAFGGRGRQAAACCWPGRLLPALSPRAARVGWRSAAAGGIVALAPDGRIYAVESCGCARVRVRVCCGANIS
jgi:hypothetical protein